MPAVSTPAIVLPSGEKHPLIDAINDMLGDGADREKAVKWLYDVLTILDNKTAHLLRLDAMILAAQTFLLKLLFDQVGESMSGSWKVALLVLLAVPLVGVGYSLVVFRVKWPFLSWTRRDSPVASTLEGECLALARACSDRTAAHRRVWGLTVMAVLGFGLALLLTCYWVW
jgi:hypothetical protein